MTRSLGESAKSMIPAKAITVKLKATHRTTPFAAELAFLRSTHRVIPEQPPLKGDVFTDSKV